MPEVTLFIDADACPVTREALDVARAEQVAVAIAGNSTQNLLRHVRPGDPTEPPRGGGFWVRTIGVAVGSDSADFAIVCELVAGEPQLTEHQQARWLAPAQMPELDWAPADREAVAIISSMELDAQ